MKPGDLVCTVGTSGWGDFVLIIRAVGPPFAWEVLRFDDRICRIASSFLAPIP